MPELVTVQFDEMIEHVLQTIGTNLMIAVPRKGETIVLNERPYLVEQVAWKTEVATKEQADAGIWRFPVLAFVRVTGLLPAN